MYSAVRWSVLQMLNRYGWLMVFKVLYPQSFSLVVLSIAKREVLMFPSVRYVYFFFRFDQFLVHKFCISGLVYIYLTAMSS